MDRWIIISPDIPPVFYDDKKMTASPFAMLGEECQLHPPSSTSSSHSQYSSTAYSRKVCAPGLECFVHSNGSSICERLSTTTTTTHQQQRKHYKREDGNTFKKPTHHTTAFNVVHVIAAVLGIAGAALVSVTAFIMCRRRRRRLAREKRHTASTTLSNNDIQETSMHRFNQFAQDYHHDAEDNQLQLPPKTHQQTTDKEPLVSPSMQQIHLHRQLLERHQQAPLPPPPYYP
ncbi:hypothetical protein O0I10_012955 [Lichtheimia ornata]|uniref:Uncharacterized protein n=1 Tax=Lichtheimia ornata TaxID=688661 RepID=A0AAD7UQU6_9FUNG|nr:uncharacterized protein O0I10_012955 [Lichtheimia ornata]KAJ8651490.1 hypothetical protein O0I10_012955 [Lichtheimia ornata]